MDTDSPKFYSIFIHNLSRLLLPPMTTSTLRQIHTLQGIQDFYLFYIYAKQGIQ